MVLNVEHPYDFGKVMDGLMKQILMVDFGGTSDTGLVEDQKMMKGKLIDGNKLSVGLEAIQLR